MDARSKKRARVTSQKVKDLEILDAKQFGGEDFNAQHRILGWNQLSNIEITMGDIDPAI